MQLLMWCSFSELEETQMYMKALDTERSELDEQLEEKDKALKV